MRLHAPTTASCCSSVRSASSALHCGFSLACSTNSKHGRSGHVTVLQRFDLSAKQTDGFHTSLGKGDWVHMIVPNSDSIVSVGMLFLIFYKTVHVQLAQSLLPLSLICRLLLCLFRD